MSFDPLWSVYGLLALGALILVLRFGKWLVYGALLAGIVVALVTVANAFNRQARATEQVATVATRATTRQSVLVWLLLLVLVGAAAAIGYLTLRLRDVERRSLCTSYAPRSEPQVETWLSGPNANWQRNAPNPGAPDVGASVQSLVQLEVLRTLRELRGPEQPTAYALPPAYEQDNEYEEQNLDADWGW